VTPLVAIPIRSFSGMARLSDVLDGAARADMIRELASTALAAAAAAGATGAVVTADPEVAAWASRNEVVVVSDPGTSLDAAATAGVAFAAGRPWVVLHGDLPGVQGSDIAAIIGALGDRPVLAPSKDGGTSAVADIAASFPFHFGPGSFQRHLAVLKGKARVVVRCGLAVDIDRPADLVAWRVRGRL